jgi:hypothetical protein
LKKKKRINSLKECSKDEQNENSNELSMKKKMDSLFEPETYDEIDNNQFRQGGRNR